MEYYTVWADYRSKGMITNGGVPLRRKPPKLTDALWDDLQKWVSEYSPITLSGKEITEMNLEQIRELDSRGLELASMIAMELGNDAKVQYLSEALLVTVLNIDHLNRLLARQKEDQRRKRE